MRKTAFAILVTSLSGLAGTASAEVPLAGEALAVYGKVHVSVDYLNSDVTKDQGNASSTDRVIDSSFGVSSNSSRIGFRGRKPINESWDVTYQIEQQYETDAGGGQFATRNTYLGFAEPSLGELRIGRHDTPFKDIASEFGEFSDTIGDRRAILGAQGTGGNTMNARADNVLLYRNTVATPDGELNLSGLYSADANDAGQAPDNNSNRVISLGATWTAGPLLIGGAIEDWSQLAGGEARGIRLLGEYRFGDLEAGLILESIDHDLDAGGDGPLDRTAVGTKVAYQAGPTRLAAHLLLADDYGDVDDSSAVMTSIGAFHDLGEGLSVYTVATRTQNDSNAAYQGVDGGHGDELGTVPGGDPYALSVGAVLKF